MMAYNLPKHIKKTKIDKNELIHSWDDNDVQSNYTANSDRWLSKALKLTTKAQLALGIGIYEWIVWRLYPHMKDTAPIEIAEAAWCGVVDKKYVEYTELERKDWTGPVNGPLWCAVTWLIPMVFHEDDGIQQEEGSLEDGLDYLYRLAMHVIPNNEDFEKWLDETINRLQFYYELTNDDDPFDDLFELKDTTGAPVSKEAMDPTTDYTPQKANRQIKKYMDSLDPQNNPYLKLKQPKKKKKT